MKFDINVFKTYYGNKYVKNVKAVCVSFFASLSVFLLLILLRIQIPYVFAILLGLIILVSAFLVIVFYCDYKKYLERAKRQKVWFHDNKLNVKIVPVSGFTWGAIEHHSYHYIVDKVSNVEMNDRFIIVNGEIRLTENDNGNKFQSILENLEIPRTFQGENMILKIKENNYE